MPRLSANLSFLFTDLPFLARFEAAAKAGFTAVEFAFAYDHRAADIAAAARAHGLAVVLINAPPGDFAAGERGLASLPQRRHDFEASMRTALAYATVLDCPCVHVMAGIVAPDPDEAVVARRREAQREALVENLRRVCPDAEAAGVTLLLEALNPGDMPHYLYSRQEDVHAVRRLVGATNLKVQMDLYHAQRVEGAITEKLQRWLPDIGHIQIASVPGRHEPDDGELDYRYLFRVLDELGYAGWVGCEYHPRTTTEAGLSWRERLR
jgi:hydroxypyruvate isomerase